MLTDAALHNLKPKSKIYKASDREGRYVAVSTSGTVTFRDHYRLNGRRETLTLGRYGPGGISLAMGAVSQFCIGEPHASIAMPKASMAWTRRFSRWFQARGTCS